MPRIHYDEESLNNFINPNLSKAVENIDLAISLGSLLNVTVDLACKGEINELATFFKDKKSRINRVQNIIENSRIVAGTSYEEVKIGASALSQNVLDAREL